MRIYRQTVGARLPCSYEESIQGGVGDLKRCSRITGQRSKAEMRPSKWVFGRLHGFAALPVWPHAGRHLEAGRPRCRRRGAASVRGGCIADIPQRANDIVRTSAKKSPCKPDQSLAGIGAHAGTLACGDGHQIRMQGLAQDVTRVELSSIWRISLCREDDRGIERHQLAGDGVGNEMDIVKAARVTSDICGG